MGTLITAVIFTFVGWTIPQPAWAKALQAAVVAKVKAFLAK